MLFLRQKAVRLAIGGVTLAGIALGTVRLISEWRQRRDLTPLVTSPAAQVSMPLPADTFVFRVASAPVIEAPFARQRRAAAEGTGDILVFPDRGGAENNHGRAAFTFQVDRPGPYEVWIRARWENQCGNSVLCEVNGSHGYTAGQDAIYDTWHWVRAGRHTLVAGTNRVALVGREDGIALDELLLTPSPTFVPHAAALAPAPTRDLRQVADDFARSPGHGLAPWQPVSGQWDIAFTLDPNRIPNQYALTGRPGTNNAEAMAELQADPWDGVRLVFSFSPVTSGEAGAFVARGADGRQATAVLFHVTSNTATLHVEGPDGVATCDLGDRMRLGQWHRVAIEQWAWVMRVAVDDVPVFTSTRMKPAAGTVAFFVRSGAAVFDDAVAVEIPWQAEGGDSPGMPWSVDHGAQWDRIRGAQGGGLAGRYGNIRTGIGGLPVRAVLVEDNNSAVCHVNGAALVETSGGADGRLLDVAAVWGAADVVSLAPGSTGRAWIRRMAVAYGATAPEVYVDGPHHFTSQMIEDQSDYLDFTPEEYRQTVAPGDAGKLRREMRTFPVVGRRTDGSVWAIKDGRWLVNDGALIGTALGTLQYWRDTYVSMEMRARVSLAPPISTAAVDLFAGMGVGLRAHLGPALVGAASATNALALVVPADGVFHDVRVRVDGARLEGAVDGLKPVVAMANRASSGAFHLAAISGNVRFDDIRFIVPRAGKGEYFYAFDRRETDWWREGGAWIDHGGIACVLASHWISLVAPAGRGVLWNKRAFGPELLVATTIEENSEWFGWDASPSHTHHPYDNICILLAPETSWDTGYRLEVNARNHATTVLYRAGAVVASVPQDHNFPMRYIASHQAYEPRRNHVTLTHTGAVIRAFVNGVQVLTYEDPTPLRVTRVGLGGYDTHANFSRIEIRELRQAPVNGRD